MSTPMTESADAAGGPAARTTVSIIVPAYNEGIGLAANLKAIDAYLEPFRDRYDFELILVDDGSTDDTALAAERFAHGRGDAVLLRHDRNLGLGAALRTGFTRASGDYLITLDSDLSYGPQYAIRMLEAMEQQGADIVLASAYMPGGSVANVPWIRRMLSREANRFLSLATNARLHTLTCMVRAYRASAIRPLAATSNGMEANPEILFAALRRGARVVEIPARLEWTIERARGASRLNVKRAWSHFLGVLRCGFSYRPALLLGIPALLPLLPMVAAVLLLLHVSPQVFAAGMLAAIVVQYTSLAILAGQATTFLGKNLITHKRHAPR